MKNVSPAPASIRDSVAILRCRGVELADADRREVHRSEAALGHVFQRIHRIEWIFTGRPHMVELRCAIRALRGEFAASAIEGNARSSIQAVTEKILKQKGRAKTTSVTKRKAARAGGSRAL